MENNKKNNTPKKKPNPKGNPDFSLGNRFWERRATHGREKIFAEPKIMWDAAVEYFIDTVNNPLYAMEVVGGKLTKVPKIQAFTMMGLTLFLGVNDHYFSHFKKALAEKMLADPDGKIDPEAHKLNTDFSTVIKQIEQTIYQQKFTAASAGLLNANIISRDLGLMDKKEVDHKNNGGSFKANQVTVFRIPDNGRDGKLDNAPTEPADTNIGDSSE